MVFSFIKAIDNNDDEIDDDGESNNVLQCDDGKLVKKHFLLISLSLNDRDDVATDVGNAGDDDANDVDGDEVDIFSVRRPFPISAGVDICLGAPTTTTRY